MSWGLSLVQITRNHRVHVDTHAREVGDIDHGANTGNGNLACRHLGIDNVHDILVGGLIFGD